MEKWSFVKYNEIKKMARSGGNQTGRRIKIYEKQD